MVLPVGGPDRTRRARRTAVRAWYQGSLGDRLRRRQRVGRSASFRRRGGREELARKHPAVTRRDASCQHVGQRCEVGHRRCLAAVERVLDRRPPPAGLKINEIGHVARGDLEAERMALDCGAVEKLRVRPHRGDRRHLVDSHFGWRCRTHRCHQRDGRVVSASLVGRRFTAGGDEIQAAVAARRAGEAQRETAIGPAFRLGELHGGVRTCSPKRDRRVGDRGARAEDLTFELLLRGRWRDCHRNHGAECEQNNQNSRACFMAPSPNVGQRYWAAGEWPTTCPLRRANTETCHGVAA